MTDTIYARPADYDLEHEGDAEDIGFYRQIAERLQPRRILELACGSGRVTLPLAAALRGHGREVVGIDLSEEMLAQADAKREHLEPTAGAAVRFVSGDMRTWRDDRLFDLVIVPCSSLCHLLTLDDQLACWQNARANLAPGGRFIADVTMPNLPAYAESMQHPPRALVEMDIDAETPDSAERLIRYKTTTYLPHLQRARIHFLYDKFDAAPRAERYVSDFESHVYFPRELELLFLLTGFRVEACYGDYAFRPLRPTSRQLLMIGRVAV